MNISKLFNVLLQIFLKNYLHPSKQEEYTAMDENVTRFTIIDSIMYLILIQFEFGLLAAKYGVVKKAMMPSF